MLQKFKNLFSKSKPELPQEKPKRTKKPKTQSKPEPSKLTDKEKATAAGQPYVTILKVDVDPENINAGAFELDWNDKFVLNLIRAGYKQREDDTEQDIVDRWFQVVCRNIALEVYEQQVADPKNRNSDLRYVAKRDLGNGRSEVS